MTATWWTEPIVLVLAAIIPLVAGASRQAAAARSRAWGASALLGAALASLATGAGALEVDAWRGYAEAVPGGRAFVAAGVGGVLMAGAAAAGGGRRLLAITPLAALVILSLRGLLLVPATAAGAAIVALVLVAGGWWGRWRTVPTATVAPPWPLADRLVLTVAVLAVLLGGPLLLVLALYATLLWRVHAAMRTPWWWVPPLLGVLVLTVIGWLALTIAATPWQGIRTFQTDVPLSAAAERLLGHAWVTAVALTAGCWPLARGGRAMRVAPLAIAFAAVGGQLVTPDGVAAWLPLTTMVLVPSAVIAAARQDLAGMAGALAAMSALHPGWFPLGAGLLVLAWPVAREAGAGNTSAVHRVTLHVSPVGAIAMALGIAGCVYAVFRDEVVLGTALAVGLGLALPARDARPDDAT